MDNDERKVFGLAISKISEVEFFMNESALPQNIDNGVKVNFIQETRIGLALNLVVFVLTVDYFLPQNLNDKILSIKVENWFNIYELEKFVKEGNLLELPQDALVSIVSLSISHTRAILSKHTAGTLFATHLIPLVNPVQITKEFFPDQFKD